MFLFHRTNSAESILRDGFVDAGPSVSGVWLSDTPWKEPEVKGIQVLRIRIPVEAIREFETWEWTPSYRVFLVPARLANRYGPPTLLSAAEQDRIDARHSRRLERQVKAAGGWDAWTAREMEKSKEDDP